MNSWTDGVGGIYETTTPVHADQNYLCTLFPCFSNYLSPAHVQQRKRRQQGSPLQTSASKGINGGRNLDKNFFSFMGLCHLKFGTVVMWMAGYNSHSAFRNLLPSFSVPPSLKVYPSMGDSCCRLLKVSSALTDCLSFYLFLSFKSFTFSWN